MIAAPSRDWRVFKPICAEHWEALQHAHPRDQTSYYAGLVAQRLGGGHPEQMGSIAYRCLPCGQGKQRVSLRCQSSWCLRCATVSVDNWVSQVGKVLHEGVISRHIILTVPAMCRTPFSQHAAVLLRALRPCGGQGLEDCSRAVRGKTRRGGSITGLQTHGRHGP